MYLTGNNFKEISLFLGLSLTEAFLQACGEGLGEMVGLGVAERDTRGSSAFPEFRRMPAAPRTGLLLLILELYDPVRRKLVVLPMSTREKKI